LKAGKIIPFQQQNLAIKTTTDLNTQSRISFLIMRDESQYADGYTLVDDGITTNIFNNTDYTFWKLRYAEKSINFWVQYGDFDYVEPAGMSIATLQDIQILQAADLADTDFACFMGRNLYPVNMTIDYNPDTQVLRLKPTAANNTIKFADIGFIKFGNTKIEPNFCDY
jgi:hypothetical protein